MGSKFEAAQRLPAPKPRNLLNPPVQQKEVLLFEWWLMKAEKGYNGRWLTLGGFTKRGDAVGIFRSAPIIKRHDHCTLETADGMTIRIQGPINKTRTIDNGFLLEASNAFLFGFPTTWDNFAKESSGNKPSDWRMLEHQPETTFDSSFQQKTVLLRNWWLRKAEESDGSTLAVGGFTECGKAMRVFDSSPIVKRHDAYTLDTADGVTIRIEGFINKMRTLDNGFPIEVCKTFLIGFPTTWFDFANVSSRDRSSRAEISVSASSGIERPKDSLENVSFGFPVNAENTLSHNVPSTSNTFVRDCDTRLREAIHKFSALVSMFNPVRMPVVDSGSRHLLEKSFCDDNRLKEDESCGANIRDAHTNNQLQDDKSCGTNLRDAHTGYNDYEVGHTAVDNDSKNLEASFTEGVHTEGSGRLTGDLHVDGIPQEISLNNEKLQFIQDAALNICKKCNGHALKKHHHDDGLGTRCTTNLWDPVVGKDNQKEETAQKKDEKFDECLTRKPKKVRLGVSKVENLHGKVQKYAEFTVKSVRRSPRLKSLNHPENVHGGFQYNSQFLNETNDMNCANLVPGRSKSCTSQPTDTLVEGRSSSPNLFVDAQKFAKPLAKPVRKSEGFHGEFQDYSQYLDETNNMNYANLSRNRSKTHARKANYDMIKGSPLSPTSSILLPSAAVLSEENQDYLQHSINMCLGVTPNSNSASKYVCCDDSTSTACLGQSLNDKKTSSSDCIAGLFEETFANSEAVISQTVEKLKLRCSRKNKDNQTARSRMKVAQNDSRNQLSGTSFEENISFSSSNSRRKAKHVEVSTETQQAEDKASHKIGYKTVWVSSYTDFHGTPLTRYKKNKSSFLSPESLNLKRSRSGRLLIPRLDCSKRIIYEPDGSFAGTASVMMPTSQCKGSGTKLDRKKRKKQC